MSILHLSLPNKVWNTLQPMPFAILSPLIVSNAQNIYVLGYINCVINSLSGEHYSMYSLALQGHPAAHIWEKFCIPQDETDAFNFSVVFRYCTTSNTWDQCSTLPAVVNRDNADVVVHDGAINVFTSTKRFKYSEDSDTWSSDHYQLEGNLVKVFVKGNDVRCVTCQKPDDVQQETNRWENGRGGRRDGRGGYSGGYGCDRYNDRQTYSNASAMETQKTKYYLQTYDVSTNQWIEKEQMDLGNEKPTFFF